MQPAAITSDVDRPRRCRAFLERWADSNRVARPRLERLLTAVDGWRPDAPLVVRGLDGSSFYDPQRFPWMADLAGMASALRRELEELSDRMSAHPETAALVEQGGWRAYFLWRSGQRVAGASTAPVASMASALGAGGGQAGNAYYSVIDPGTRLRRHTGPFNGRLRCHLGLDVPASGCDIEIDGEHRSWRNDECLVFSDFPPHSVTNVSGRGRAVFVLDFWHPDLTVDERNALAALLAGHP